MAEACIGTHSEAEIIRQTVENAPGDLFGRRKWNVEGTLLATTPDEFWKWLVLSLLSSQQPYREGSPAWKLENDVDPFPLRFQEFGSLDEKQINERLKQFRFHQRIAKQLLRNYCWLFSAGGGWSQTVQPLLASLLEQRNSRPSVAHKDMERICANTLAAKLEGIGPKQARNLLQSLGLTRYEIPLDRRVVGWLQSRLGWNIVIEALSRKDYYEDLLDRVQVSCEAAGVLPTLFDAAAFDEMGRAKTMKANTTTCTGYVNRNGQVVVRNTCAAGTDTNQYIYQLACSQCGHVYGANGSDTHERLCPQCQGGAKGLTLP
jgi:hypothetical protein